MKTAARFILLYLPAGTALVLAAAVIMPFAVVLGFLVRDDSRNQT